MKLGDCYPILEDLLRKVPTEVKAEVKGGFLPFRKLPWPPRNGPCGYFAVRTAAEEIRRLWIGRRDGLSGIRILSRWLHNSMAIKTEGECAVQAICEAASPIQVGLFDVAALMQALIHVDEWQRPSNRVFLQKLTGVDCNLMDPEGEWPGKCLGVELVDAARASPAHSKPFYSGALVNFRSEETWLDSSAGVSIRRLQPWEWSDSVISAMQDGHVPVEAALGITHCIEVDADILDPAPFSHQDDLGLIVDVVAVTSSGHVFSPWLTLLSRDVLLSPLLKKEKGTRGPTAHGRGVGGTGRQPGNFERVLRSGIELRRERFFRNAIRATREGAEEPELDWRLTQLYGAVAGFLCCPTDDLCPQRAAAFVQTGSRDFDDCLRTLENARELRNYIVHKGDRYESFTSDQQTACLDGLNLLTNALFDALLVMLSNAPTKALWRQWLVEVFPE